jgi:hypothetical protein
MSFNIRVVLQAHRPTALKSDTGNARVIFGVESKQPESVQ